MKFSYVIFLLQKQKNWVFFLYLFTIQNNLMCIFSLSFFFQQKKKSNIKGETTKTWDQFGWSGTQLALDSLSNY